MASSTNDRDVQGTNDEQRNKESSSNSKEEKSTEQKAALDPNHQKPENAWSPGNESERQSTESDEDRMFDKGGDGLKDSGERDSSNSLYTEKSVKPNKEQQHAGTITENKDRNLSGDSSWKTGSHGKSKPGSSGEEGAGD